MFFKCSNPDCETPFDYRQGQLVRFCRLLANGAEDQHAVEHYWLCGSCSEIHVLGQEAGSIRVERRSEQLALGKTRNFLKCA